MEKSFFPFLKNGIFHRALPAGSAWVPDPVLDYEKYFLPNIYLISQGAAAFRILDLL